MDDLSFDHRRTLVDTGALVERWYLRNWYVFSLPWWCTTMARRY
jgi:hypothetical protein